jgi:YolD-like protein
MVNKDRGIMKWHAALLLPEHVKLHRNWQEEMNYKIKPELDEQKLEDMDLIIHEAMEYTLPVLITYFKNHNQYQTSGHIHYYDSLNREIRIVSLKGHLSALRLSDLTDIQRYQEE